MFSEKQKKIAYWLAQFIGWGLLYLIDYSAASENKLKEEYFIIIGVAYISNILISHLYRLMVIKYNWFKFKPVKLITVVFFSAIGLGILQGLFMGCMQNFFFTEYIEENTNLTVASYTFIISISFSIYFFFWSLIYFSFHFIEKSRGQELVNLKWEASKNEIELNNLKSQLNPHFMFNSMNSIRALIDEDPARAKEAVTQLSLILRNTLMMGKKKTVSLKDELEIVKEYLSLEGIRYEERLKVKYGIEESTLEYQIPPLMIQTIIENAIKHGIAASTKGGLIELKTKTYGDKVQIIVNNSGKLNVNTNNKGTGIGLVNTEKRLQLLYGDKASLKLTSNDNIVSTVVEIPK